MRRLIPLLPLAAMVSLSCSSSPPERRGKNPNSLEWYQHQKEIRDLTQYEARGIFVYLSEQKKVSARFFWQQNGRDDYRLLLLNLLGHTVLELNTRSGYTQITDRNGNHYISDKSEKMIYSLTGMLIPLNNLHQWILGLPADISDYKLNDQYRLSELNYSQNGKTWKIVYSRYDRKIIPPLPSSIELTNDQQTIKLRMDNWIVK